MEGVGARVRMSVSVRVSVRSGDEEGSCGGG